MISHMIKNKYSVTVLIVLLLAGMILGTGFAFMEGENPIKLGVTLWYLNSTDRDGLKIAADTDRHLIKLDLDNMGGYISSVHNSYRGDWVLQEALGNVLTFEDGSSSETRYLEVKAESFLNKYYIVQILAQ